MKEGVCANTEWFCEPSSLLTPAENGVILQMSEQLLEETFGTCNILLKMYTKSPHISVLKSNFHLSPF